MSLSQFALLLRSERFELEAKRMGSKREREDNEGEGELLESKRQNVSELESPDSSPPASLLPGFHYGDEDEEERKAPVNGKELVAGLNGAPVEEEEEDDDGEQGLYQGHRSREIEIRRDCPYLDAVNRQVYTSLHNCYNVVFMLVFMLHMLSYHWHWC